ncbi:hypothetical protein B4098_0676 [Heyndrickxia coagulans]|uniref:Uncharacterized protein n=1 Tax=Heyndrickxia coagulans TaxID=1398 RepID=A0A150K1H5_HEYCO|nr:hypothetical protein BCO26_0539 [Heyndrickxia coagulans 2-6]KYC63332.1 hypothetical protein B4098_0676 [Heyndrickxia coagulans]
MQAFFYAGEKDGGISQIQNAHAGQKYQNDTDIAELFNTVVKWKIKPFFNVY